MGCEMFSNEIDIISVHSPNLRNLLNSKSNVNVLDEKAFFFLQKTLPKSVRKNIELDENQFIDIKKFKKIDSEDENFLALQILVNSKDITEVATAKEGMYGPTFQKFFLLTFSALREKEIQEAIKTRNINKEQAEKEIQLYGPASELTGYLGQTYSPNGENGSPKSPSGNLRAVATDQTGDGITEQDAVITMGHELFGHAYFFRIGNKTWAGEGPVITAIQERTKKNYLG